MSLLWAELGRIRYGPALELQRRLHLLRARGEVGDVVLSLEHEPVITMGRRGRAQHVLASPEELQRLGVEVYAVERGGDVTYHGPGQLVLYPILDLRGWGRDLRTYVADLEEIMIRAARDLGVEAFRREGYPGVWHGLGKLGAVGVHVRRWITMHGLAFNVNLEPDGFRLIVPCGIPGARAVSLAEILGRPVSMGEAQEAMRRAVHEVWNVSLVPAGQEVIADWKAGSLTG